ncbi:hypothetical protein ACFLWU_03325 [Chloroflexota bacterium]
MGENLRESPKSGIGQAIRSLLFAVIACVIVIFLFSSSGPVSGGPGLNLSFLIPAFVGYYIFRLFSRLSGIFLVSYYGTAAANIFNGLAFSFLFYHLLGQAMLFTRIPALEELGWLFSSLSSAKGYVLLFIFGCVLSKLAGLLSELSWGKQIYPPGNALGQFLVGLSLWQVLAAFSDSWAPMNRIGLILFAGMLVVSLSNIGTYGERLKNPFIVDASRWLRQSQEMKFILGALIAAYIFFIRPAIVGVFRYAPLIEWVLVCFAAWRLFTGIKSGLKTHCAVLLQEADWRKHVQQTDDRQGLDFINLGDIQHRFVTQGARDSLLVYLVTLLNDNRLPVAEINRILHSLINHQDAKIPWFAFGWEQQRTMRRNEKERKRILSEIMENLKDIANPAYQKIKERIDETNEPG